MCASLPLVTVAGAFAHGRSQYVLLFVLLASGVYTTPGLVVTWLAIQRSPAGDRRHWQMWLVAQLLVYGTGLSMVAGVLFGWRFGNAGGPVVVTLIGVCLTAGLVRLVRSRSGRRALSVNLAESIMSTVVVTAPAALLWGEQILRSDDAWFTIPAALATVGMVSGLYWTVLLYVRQGDQRCVLETMGIALTLLGAVNGAGQVAQGLSGFTLPSAPLIAVHAACMSLLLLVPLNARHRRLGQPREVLPLQAQVRGARLAALLVLTGLPVLLIVTLAIQEERPWATGFSLGVAALLLVLAALRQLAAVGETRRLYAQVERAATDRHELLVRMMRRSDDDRHRVAAQLHEQAISAYATFVSFLQATHQRTGSSPGPTPRPSDASSLVREDLARQAESLRQLMLAIRPIEIDRRRSESLDAPIQAYLDSLYGDSVTPRLTVSVDPELVLDWITETLVFRIVQEALRNTWRHSQATRLSVEIGSAGPAVEVRISDDGVGFDPSASLFESGIAAMRSFAAVGDGSLHIESAPGEGTRIVARLGDKAPAPPTPTQTTPPPISPTHRHLHAVTT